MAEGKEKSVINMRLFVSKCVLFIKRRSNRDFKNHHFDSFARFLMTLQYT